MKKYILLFLLPLTAFSLCDSLFLPKYQNNLVQLRPDMVSEALKREVSSLDEEVFLRKINTELKRKSDLKKLELAQDGKLETDVVVLGGGVHGSIYANGAKQLDPKAKILVIDRFDCLGVFNCMGETFFINSPEYLNGAKQAVYSNSKNYMPGMPLQPSDFKNLKSKSLKIAKEYYIPGKYLGATSNASIASSGADLLMEYRIVSVTRTRKGPYRYEITLNSGDKVYANKVVIPSGLGNPSFPFKNVATRKTIVKRLNKGIYTVESFLRSAQKTLREGEDPLARYVNKKVAVVGGGDGGNIVTEYLLGKGPKSSIRSQSTPNEVVWFGQKSANAKEFSEKAWERYHDIAPHFPGGKSKELITPVNAYVDDITELSDGRFLIKSEKGERIVDEVVFCSGYKTDSKDIFKEFLRDGELPTSKVLAKDSEVVARRIEGEELYFIGPEGQNVVKGGGGLGTTLDDAGGANTPRIEVLAPKSFKFSQLDY